MRLEKNQPQEAQNVLCEHFDSDATNLYSNSFFLISKTLEFY